MKKKKKKKQIELGRSNNNTNKYLRILVSYAVKMNSRWLKDISTTTITKKKILLTEYKKIKNKKKREKLDQK
jgi:hypothetical protein